MGILSSSEYLECSASDLVAEYVGQTGPKTRDVLKKGLGKVLFIDEAYRLCEGQFAHEAVNELVDSLTKPQFMGKVVVILAGYNEDINRLLKVNPGLSSRFPEEVPFENMKPEECIELLRRELEKRSIKIGLGFQQPTSSSYIKMMDTLKELRSLPSWGNGRDIKTLSKSLAAAALEAAADDLSSPLIVTVEDTRKALQSMLQSQKARSKGSGPVPLDIIDQAASKAQSQTPSAKPPTPFKTTAAINTTTEAEEPPPIADKLPTKTPDHANPNQCDPGVSDIIWNDLQASIAANSATERANAEALAAQAEQVRSLRAEEEARRQEIVKLEQAAEEAARRKHEAELKEFKRRQEEERIRQLEAKRAREEAEERLRKAQEENRRKKEEEEKAQRKLKEMGVCPAGFRWHRMGGGWRCAGGSHFVSEGQLGL